MNNQIKVIARADNRMERTNIQGNGESSYKVGEGVEIPKHALEPIPCPEDENRGKVQTIYYEGIDRMIVHHICSGRQKVVNKIMPYYTVCMECKRFKWHMYSQEVN